MRPARFLLTAPLLLLSTVLAATVIDREPDVGFIVTPERVVTAMLELAGTGPDDLVVDLGSGDGRIPIAAARDFGATAWGVEIDAELVEISRRNAEAAGVSGQVHFSQDDIFETDFSSADVLTLYLLPELNRRLKAAILAMPAGTRVVSHEFGMGRWPADATRQVGGHPIHLWTVPANIGGRWQISDGERVLQLRIHQDFQRFSGTAEWQGEVIPLRDTHLSGREFRFRLALDQRQEVFRGRMRDGEIEQLSSSPALSGTDQSTIWILQTRDSPSP
ncbi:SAM-dependent methyltransferase [Natronospira bacteriovora]|uniref:Methyltransferase domain-containing protein n=1 Tax=Natronospira bacteriovora TaxID=3069753 RepID=A0ABU0W4S1_9GAMM|nr:methyltransferase domain-containing protein [Natronospira sp. AB-CW4]MDQ2069018.1 methyltransferase domain-containing protein [Natronospira sp. AB-CW4]